MQIEINAKKREAQGTGASRRLRRTGNVPGVVYGGGKDAVSIELNLKDLFLQFRHEAFHSSILNLNLEGKKEQVLLRDYQMHPVRNDIAHIDFQRVSATEKIHVKVPLHFINADIAPGVKLAHGIVTHIFTEADVTCLPKNLPASDRDGQSGGWAASLFAFSQNLRMHWRRPNRPAITTHPARTRLKAAQSVRSRTGQSGEAT
jgi:large subunit ribosomal protein L25